MAVLETPPVQDLATHMRLVATADRIALSQEEEIIQFLRWLHAHG